SGCGNTSQAGHAGIRRRRAALQAEVAAGSVDEERRRSRQTRALVSRSAERTPGRQADRLRAVIAGEAVYNDVVVAYNIAVIDPKTAPAAIRDQDIVKEDMPALILANVDRPSHTATRNNESIVHKAKIFRTRGRAGRKSAHGVASVAIHQVVLESGALNAVQTQPVLRATGDDVIFHQ